MTKKHAIILLNIGSPDTYKTKDVSRYLRQFLTDKRVINIPFILRYILVYGIIAPFRSPKSAKKYKEIWTKNGSPLIHISNELKNRLQIEAGHDVYMAMRYGNPSIKNVLKNLEQNKYRALTILPMYPQNASSTTSSCVNEVFKQLNKWEYLPQIKLITEFWNHPLYLETYSNHIKKFNPESFDHVVFSFHGLPLSQVNKAHNNETCSKYDCTNEINENNNNCYQATCYATAIGLIRRLNLSPDFYSIAFQSRLDKNWLSPFTDDTLIELSKQGKKKIMVICPSFVADCLETLHEIEIEYNHIFIKNGGESIKLVPALNSEYEWIKALNKIILS